MPIPCVPYTHLFELINPIALPIFSSDQQKFYPKDLDVVMKDGMGMRYAFMGPMETIHLNAEGTQNYCDRYGDTIYNVSQDLGPIPTGWKYDNNHLC